ncbi:hypothetical protein SBA1_300018 [Candidatus Sulfotelmatobacter kueseliae]|uniref:Uncharacterized protein n=1 Tax=Candidatus Sulfotelmatobacter kueseliae TaxID=2042962 RepID=A0A2U3KLN4_9BACT|nr:hypothetical protein SBA1_300018 [Candidatus Sulfotelmatobacter kueseliae]
MLFFEPDPKFSPSSPSLVHVSEDRHVNAGVSFEGVEDAKVFVLVHAEDEDLGNVVVVVNFQPVARGPGHHDNKASW